MFMLSNIKHIGLCWCGYDGWVFVGLAQKNLKCVDKLCVFFFLSFSRYDYGAEKYIKI